MTGSRGRVLEYRADGLAQPATGAYVLKAPFSLGAQWSGEHGSDIRITSVDRAIQVPAGSFVGCLETVETLAERRTTTIYCPEVGIVSLEVEAPRQGGGRALERAVLRSFGAPVDLAAPKR